MNRTPSPGAEPETYLTMAQVAERLDRPVATLRWWRVNRRGPVSANVGGRVRYRLSDVEAWIEQQFADDAHTAAGAR